MKGYIKHILIFSLLALCTSCELFQLQPADRENLKDPGTRERNWGAAVNLTPDSAYDSYYPQVAVDQSGNAIVVWEQYEAGDTASIWRAGYLVDSGWSTAELLENGTSGGGYNPRIAFDGSGNALVVWEHWDAASSITSILSRRYSADGGWASVEPVENNDSEDAYEPRFAFDDNGTAFAVWRQGTYPAYDIWSNAYDTDNGWGTAVRLSNDEGNASSPSISCSGSGNALVVWEQYDGTRYNIWSNHHDSIYGWHSAALVEVNPLDSARDPAAALDSSGNGLALWWQWDGSYCHVRANRFSSSTGWGTAEKISTGSSDDWWDSVKVSFPSQENAIAVWEQWANDKPCVWTSSYSVSQGWDTAETLESSTQHYSLFPDLGFDSSGNGLAVWYHGDTSSGIGIWSNLYIPDSGWGFEEEGVFISTLTYEMETGPDLAVDSSGNAIAVWEYPDAENISCIYASVYSLGE